ncbi:MAG: SDR family oxidoreductase [Actinomycetota bacterium]|nr:SDR family oxidoreductase [Actinomycetota bacterium]
MGRPTKVIALELGQHGMRVKAVAAWLIAHADHRQEGQPPSPLKRAARPGGDAREVAALIAWLASDQSTYVTGASYVIDGA